MTIPTVPLWPQADPFPYVMPVVSDIQPFTYRDGMTFLEILTNLQSWLNDVFVPEVNTAIGTASTNYQAGITNSENAVTNLQSEWTTQFNSYMANVNASLEALNDQAAADLANNPTSALGTALRNLFETVSDATTLHSAIDAINTTIATLATQSSVAANTANITANTTAVQDNGYIYGGFLGNGTGIYGAQGEKLALFYSPDGKNLFGGMNNPAYVPADGEGLRDPSLLYWNGTWFCAYTSNNGNDKDFGIASSKTGAPGTWTLLSQPSGASITSLVQLWAPEFVVDGSDVYIFYSSIDVNNHGSIWWIKATDSTLANWSTPQPIVWGASGAPVHWIDGAFVKRQSDGAWCMYYSDGQNIDRAVSTTGITGTYSTDKTGNWANWGTGLEGPEVYWDPVSSVYRMYFDNYVAGTGYQWSESVDMEGWTTPVAVNGAEHTLRTGEVLRHGSFRRLPDRHSANKVLAWFMNPAHRHAEFVITQTIQNGVVAPFGSNANDTIVYDTNESIDQSLVTWDSVNKQFVFNAMGEYSICANVGVSSGSITGVTRSFMETFGTHSIGRCAGGAEDTFMFNATYKPQSAGEAQKFQTFMAWTGAMASGTVVTRMRISLNVPMAY